MTSADFAFPLNVYARLLELEYGEAAHLHYGMFAHPGEPVTVAQQRASETLWARLPPPPARVLEVGIGTGTTLERLRRAGYDACGITPDAAQIELARRRFGRDLPVAQARLEDLPPPERPWDLMLLQESAQYIDPEALFEAAERLLAPSADLVVMDEFALVRHGPGDAGLHEAAHFDALAQRHGWTLVHREDLSAAARPTLEYLLRGVERHRRQLGQDLGLPSDRLEALMASNRRYLDNYRRGVFGYRLVHWRREAVTPTRLVRVTPAAAPAMRELFEATFGRAMDDAEWQWKYGSGRGCGYALMRDGRMLAHVGGVSRMVADGDEVVAACQVGDVMVRPEANVALARRGPLYDVTATLLECEIGWGARHRYGFGFPNERAYRVAARLGLYGEVDTFTRCTWPALEPGGAAPLRARALSRDDLCELGDDRRWVDARWARQREALAACIAPVRDSAWLLHRYLDHPLQRYDVLRVDDENGGDGGGGVIVVRAGDARLMLLDLVGPPSAFSVLVAAARERAGILGLPHVEAWITTSRQGWLQAEAGDGMSCAPLGIRLPANAHTAAPSIDEQRGRWFLLAGDADFT